MVQIAVSLILIFAVTLAVPRLKYGAHKKRNARILVLICILYIFGNLYFTLLARTPHPVETLEIIPFRTYRHLFDSTLVKDRSGGSILSYLLYGIRPIDEIVLNMILYYPMGYLLSAFFEKLGAVRIVFISVLASVLTELTQYFLSLGWGNADDVMHNTLGSIIGVCVWHIQTKRLRQPKKDKKG